MAEDFNRKFAEQLNKELEAEGITVDEKLINATLKKAADSKNAGKVIRIKRYIKPFAAVAACIVLCLAASKIYIPFKSSNNSAGSYEKEDVSSDYADDVSDSKGVQFPNWSGEGETGWIAENVPEQNAGIADFGNMTDGNRYDSTSESNGNSADYGGTGYDETAEQDSHKTESSAGGAENNEYTNGSGSENEAVNTIEEVISLCKEAELPEKEVNLYLTGEKGNIWLLSDDLRQTLYILTEDGFIIKLESDGYTVSAYEYDNTEELAAELGID